jgi:hypothetical protein
VAQIEMTLPVDIAAAGHTLFDYLVRSEVTGVLLPDRYETSLTGNDVP